MNMKIALLPASLVALLGFTSITQAAVTQLTNNDTSDTLPQVSGNAVVWQGQVNGVSEIFLYDLASSTTTQISTTNVSPSTVNEVSPQTDDNYVTWLGNGFGGSIHYYDIGTGGPATTVFSAITGQQINSAPQIANGRIVWTNNTVGDNVNPGEIYMYTIGSGGAAVNISSSLLDDTAPRINATTVSWNQVNDMGTADPGDDVSTIMIYDIASDTTNSAAQNYLWPESPQIDGSLSVYSQHDGADREVFLKEAQRPAQQVTDNAIEDTYPRISGNTIVWVGGTGSAAEIYSFAPTPDADADGIPDTSDNCINVANANQRDSNGDDYGNMCDADFNNDGIVNGTDLALFKMAFGSTGANLDTDFNDDGVVNGTDLALFKMAFGQPPGPSAIAP